jgi:hypothetical protein
MARLKWTPQLGFLVLAFALAALGCAKKQQTASETSTDSLLASNPQESPSGNINPQTGYQAAPGQPAPPPRSTGGAHHTSSAPAAAPTRTIPSGTPISVSVQTGMSSENANVGDSWTGTVRQSVVVDGRTLIPAGSSVTGTVSSVRSAHKGDRAMLDLALSRVDVDGRTYHVHGGTEAIEAGSTRARNLGAVAAGAGAGALIGKAVGGGGKGALIGGLIGAGAATGAVAASKGYEVVLKPGTTIDFTTSGPVAVRI